MAELEVEQLAAGMAEQVVVHHDREFVSSLATRILELKPGEAGGPATVIDFRGSYEDYLAGEGQAPALAAA